MIDRHVLFNEDDLAEFTRRFGSTIGFNNSLRLLMREYIRSPERFALSNHDATAELAQQRSAR